jgi:hypothetical protein
MKALILVLVSFLAVSALAQPGPPGLCRPCLFYAGDLNPNDPQADAFPDMYTFVFPDTKTYAGILLPAGHSILVTGILFQIQISGSPKLDPKGASWEIRSGLLTSNDVGTLIASGQIGAAVEPTGRELNYPEFTVAVNVDPPVQLRGGRKGTIYWFNVEPPCVNSKDPACNQETQQYFVSNTTQQTNSVRGSLQAGGAGYIYANNSEYNYNWDTLCGAGFTGCSYVSFGVMGRVAQ